MILYFFYQQKPGPLPCLCCGSLSRQEVCFSPEEKCDLKLIQYIKNAKKSLNIAIFDITLAPLTEAIIEQSKKIPVKILVDSRQTKHHYSLVSEFIHSPAEVRFGSQRGIMHHKFAIIDHRILQTGSFNYTGGASHFNQENQIYLWNPHIIRRYQMQFDKIWEKGRKATFTQNKKPFTKRKLRQKSRVI